MNKPKTLDELMNEYEPERLAEIARDEARRNTPEAIAKREAGAKEDHERGVRLGWWDEAGESIASDEDTEDDEDDEMEE